MSEDESIFRFSEGDSSEDGAAETLGDSNVMDVDDSTTISDVSGSEFGPESLSTSKSSIPSPPRVVRKRPPWGKCPKGSKNASLPSFSYRQHFREAFVTGM